MNSFRSILLAIAIAIVIFIGWAWWIGQETQRYQVELAEEIENRFGFTVSTPQVRMGDRQHSVLAIHPEKSGLMANAGFQDNDILISHQITALYKALYHSDNEPLVFKVVDGGDGKALNQRELRAITLYP